MPEKGNKIIQMNTDCFRHPIYFVKLFINDKIISMNRDALYVLNLTADKIALDRKSVV